MPRNSKTLASDKIREISERLMKVFKGREVGPLVGIGIRLMAIEEYLDKLAEPAPVKETERG